MKGVKIRSPEGLAAEVFKRAGAAPVSLPFSEVYTALEKGVIDAADASAHVNNNASGMYKVAKFPIYPGIHSMAVLQFIVNKKVWDKLGKDGQTALEVWYSSAYDAMRREADLQDRAIAAEQRAGGEIEVIDWTTEERAKFRTIAASQWEGVASRSPNAQKVYDVLTTYLKENGLIN